MNKLPNIDPDPLKNIIVVYPHTVARNVNKIFDIYDKSILSNSEGLRISGRFFKVLVA